MIAFQSLDIQDNTESLTSKLQHFHEELLGGYPQICRIACTIYDAKTDLLKTFINSTRKGHAIVGYQAKLSETPSLYHLAINKQCRVIDDIAQEITQGSEHSNWLLSQGYSSSFTIPIYRQNKFIGFIFIDSHENGAFSDVTQRDLTLRCSYISEVIINELSSVHLLVATASAIRNIANLRDFETGMHLNRMAELSKLIAQKLPNQFNLTDEAIEHIFLFAPLHDIGKIGIPDSILLKQGKFTDEERLFMQTHVEKGINIIDKILADFNLLELDDAKIMRNIVAYHHEYLDGSGYPFGLSGNQIPIEARIVTVADIFDALTHKRPYKNPWSLHDSMNELNRMVRIGKLDENCVGALSSALDEAEIIVTSYCDGAA